MSLDVKPEIKIAGVVVLYNPDSTVVANIKSYIDLVDLLIIIDNSTESNITFLNKFLNKEKVCYFGNGKNIGVASALNLGCSIAIDRQYTHLLTMDQDSYFDDISIKQLISVAKKIDWKSIGIISPLHVTSSKLQEKMEEIEEVLYIMTSGNILNLDIYQKVGGFLNWLFIDHIDHEYGLRLNENNYKVLQINSIKMFHELGELKTISIFGKKIFSFISHSPVRMFYMVRNGFYVAGKYPLFAQKNRILIMKEIIKIFGENEKTKRIKFVLKAVRDYYNIDK